jgi:hypothetical protein
LEPYVFHLTILRLSYSLALALVLGVLLAVPMALRAELNFPQVELDASYIAYERDVGDIDGDGLNDVVAVSDGGSSVEWFRAPTWNRQTLLTLTGTYRYTRADDFKVADVDGDGDKDLVVRLGAGPTDDGEGRAAWVDNMGSGTGWVVRIIGVSPTYGKDIAVADLDQDARLDLVYREDALTQIWFNETNGWTEVRLNHAPHEGMELGDLDMDGDPDVVLNGFWFPTPDTPAACRQASNYIQQTIDGQWYGQTGDWTANSCKVAVGDVDGDGTNDVVFSHSERAGYQVTWYRRAGASWTTHPVVGIDFAHNLQVYDADLDGDMDILSGGMTQSAQKGLRLFLNQGDGASWLTHIIQSDGSYSAELGDIDNDGDLDIVGIVNWDSAPSYLYRSNAGGPPSLDFWQYIRVSDDHLVSFGLAFADMDADGDQDIASGPYLYRNPGASLTGAWSRSSFSGAGHVFLTAEVDGDNRADLLTQLNNSGANRIDLYWVEAADAGATSWSTPVLVGHVPPGEHELGFQGWKLVQLESGGRPEVLVSSAAGLYYFLIPENPEAGAWPRVMVAANDSDEGIGVVDMDDDGDLDIAFASGVSKDVKWARNPGDGSPNWTTFTIGHFAEADWIDRCEAVDLNGDGRPDIVTTEENSGAADAVACWWEQPVAGATAPNWTRHIIVTQYTMNNLDVADFDRDGDVDLAIAEHKGTKKIAVWENDGAGLFTSHGVGQGNESHLGARAIDLDADGDLDLASIAYDDPTTLHVWRNDSPGGTPTVARPLVHPNGGVFDEPVSVTLSCSTPSADLWYTLDGSDPTNAIPSLHYTGAFFSVATSQTVRARGFKLDYAPSLLALAVFTGPQVQTPLITPPGGTFSGTQEVVLACATTGATIRFTTDGSVPSELSALFGGVITLTNTTVLRVRAFRADIVPSAEASASFTLFSLGAVAQWRFDERFGDLAYDSSGHGHTGGVYGATRVPGWKDRSLHFDGTDDHVEAGTWEVAGTAITICAWIQIEAPYLDNDSRIVSKATGAAEQDHVWMLSLTMSGADIRPRFRLKTEGATTTLIADSGHLTPGSWHHVAAVYDGTSMKLYADGSEVGAQAKSGDISASSASIFLAANPPAFYAPWKGELDDVRIYNTALSASEVVAVMAESPILNSPDWLGFHQQGSDLLLPSRGEPGHYLMLEHTTNLMAGTWSMISSNALWSEQATFTSAPPAVSGSYRLRLD